jgi:hypothetical protein
MQGSKGSGEVGGRGDGCLGGGLNHVCLPFRGPTCIHNVVELFFYCGLPLFNFDQDIFVDTSAQAIQLLIYVRV